MNVVHDLETLLSGEFHCISEVLGNDIKFIIKNRYFSFYRFTDQVSENFVMFGTMKFFRTFLSTGFGDPPINSEKAHCIILSNLMCLRALLFHNFLDLNTLLDSMGKMLHLCYLNLCMTNRKTLPESLFGLLNMQTLNLFCCRKLKMLSNDMQNLINLCHIDISFIV